MKFKFSTNSLKHLQGVHPDLVKLTHRALELTTVDFAVVDGLRTLEEQKQLYAKKLTKTMKSNHLTGHAVDICPTPNGKLDWNDEANFTKVAEAFRFASIELGIPVIWGRAWDAPLSAYPSAYLGMKAYIARKGNKAFLDGPHFELVNK